LKTDLSLDGVVLLQILILISFLLFGACKKPRQIENKKVQFGQARDVESVQSLREYYDNYVKKLKDVSLLQMKNPQGNQSRIFERFFNVYENLFRGFPFVFEEYENLKFLFYRDYLFCANEYLAHVRVQSTRNTIEYQKDKDFSFQNCLLDRGVPNTSNHFGQVYHDVFLNCENLSFLNGRSLSDIVFNKTVCGNGRHSLLFGSSFSLHERRDDKVAVLSQAKMIGQKKGQACLFEEKDEKFFLNNCYLISSLEKGDSLGELSNQVYDRIFFDHVEIDTKNEALLAGQVQIEQGDLKAIWKKEQTNQPLLFELYEKDKQIFASPDLFLKKIDSKSIKKKRFPVDLQSSKSCEMTFKELLDLDTDAWVSQNHSLKIFLGEKQNSLLSSTPFLHAFAGEQSLWCWDHWFNSSEKILSSHVFWDQQSHLWLFFEVEGDQLDLDKRLLAHWNSSGLKKNSSKNLILGALLDTLTGRVRSVQFFSNYFLNPDQFYHLDQVEILNDQLALTFKKRFSGCVDCSMDSESLFEKQSWSFDLLHLIQRSILE
jgi:hypothetical protein